MRISSLIGRAATASLSVLLPVVTFAQTQGSPSAGQVNNITNNITNLARLIITLLFVLALLVFVWGAVNLIRAAGDPEAIKEAKGFILWGVVGMAVLASVFGLVTFLQNYFGVTGAGTFTIPSI